MCSFFMSVRGHNRSHAPRCGLLREDTGLRHGTEAGYGDTAAIPRLSIEDTQHTRVAIPRGVDEVTPIRQPAGFDAIERGLGHDLGFGSG